MTKRLTERNEHGVIGTPHPMFLQEAIDKLAHYEDLEEQGRLLVLPEGFDAQALKEELIKRHCPSFIGLDDLGCEAGKSVKVSSCFECWEKAWEGKRNETTT